MLKLVNTGCWWGWWAAGEMGNGHVPQSPPRGGSTICPTQSVFVSGTQKQNQTSAGLLQWMYLTCGLHLVALLTVKGQSFLTKSTQSSVLLPRFVCDLNLANFNLVQNEFYVQRRSRGACECVTSAHTGLTGALKVMQRRKRRWSWSLLSKLNVDELPDIC